MITRRDFSWLTLSLPAFATNTSALAGPPIGDTLQGILEHARQDPALRQLGVAFLAEQPGPVCPQALESELLQRVGKLQYTDAPTLQRTLAAAVRQDFESGEVVTVDGWRFSRLEAVVAALTTFG